MNKIPLPRTELPALNAKYSHTSLSVRYLRQAVPGSEIMELTINHQLLAMLGEIYSAKPKVLGISCYIWNIELVKNLLKLLPAALPNTIIICGGPEVSYGVAEFMQDFPMVDYVCRGEGEVALPELVKYLQQVDFDRSKVNGQLDQSAIPGIAWRSLTGQINEGQDVTVADFAGKVPFAYRAEEMADIRERILYYETSRGCPFSCAYCLSCATAGVRFLPLERVFKELDFFVAHDVRQVKFVDRTFNAKKSHFLPILQYLLKLPADCRTNFHFEVAIDYLDEEVMQVLAQLPKGRVQLEIGIQSTNPATLKAVSRVNHWQDIADHIQKIMSFHNMHLHVDLIIGLPGEGMESFHKSFNDVYALQTDMLQLGFLKFLKGATMMQLIDAYHYQYMPMAPYEVLQNDVLSYGQIRWFHSFEQVQECEQGDAFAFWQKLTDWWEAQGFHKIGHSTKNLYGYLRDFALAAYALPADLLDNLLRYDALLSDGGKIRPENLNWNRLQYQDITADFWKGAPSRVRAYLPDYEFTNWRDVNKKYHIEVFAYNMMLTSQKLTGQQTALLFDYTADEPVCQRIELEIGSSVQDGV